MEKRERERERMRSKGMKLERRGKGVEKGKSATAQKEKIPYRQTHTITLRKPKAHEIHKPHSVPHSETARASPIPTESKPPLVSGRAGAGAGGGGRRRRLMAVPELHHLGPVLARQVAPVRDAAGRHHGNATGAASHLGAGRYLARLPRHADFVPHQSLSRRRLAVPDHPCTVVPHRIRDGEPPRR